MRLGERRSLRATNLSSRTITIHLFRLCWVVVLIWGELGIFFWSLSSCRWPNLKTVGISFFRFIQWPKADIQSTEKPTHVLLVSDPQVRLPSDPQRDAVWLGRIRQFVVDLNLKKSWHVATRLQPHVVVFLGDMLANGKSIKNEAE